MKYISTRNNSKEYNFEEVFIKGLADDGGLFVPKFLRKFTEAELNKGSMPKNEMVSRKRL